MPTHIARTMRQATHYAGMLEHPPLDTTDDHAEPILVALGGVVVAAATLEKVLIADITQRTAGQHGLSEELVAELAQLEMLPAGRLVKQLRALGLAEGLAARIEDVLARRNRLVHHVLEEPEIVLALRTGQGAEKVAANIEQLAADCGEISSTLAAVAFPGLEALLGASPAELAKMAAATDPAHISDDAERADLEAVQAMLAVVDPETLADEYAAISTPDGQTAATSVDSGASATPVAPLFAGFADSIRDLPAGQLSIEQLCCPQFRLQSEGQIEVFYTPFDHVNGDAHVTLIGITPGWRQMRVAYEAARDLLQQGVPHDQVLAATSDTAGFSGPMRTNLVAMLDGIGLPESLGITSSAELFAERSDLRHSTSAIRYAAFVNGRNYTGSQPALPTTPVLRRYVFDVLAVEIDQVPRSIVIPLGRSVESALALLIEAGKLDRTRCCLGFPHPSGANGHRTTQFAEARDQLRDNVARWFSSSRTKPPHQPASQRPCRDART